MPFLPVPRQIDGQFNFLSLNGKDYPHIIRHFIKKVRFSSVFDSQTSSIDRCKLHNNRGKRQLREVGEKRDSSPKRAGKFVLFSSGNGEAIQTKKNGKNQLVVIAVA